MSSTLLKSFFVMMALMAYVSVSAQFVKPDQVTINTSSETVTVNGIADEAIWAELPAYPIDRPFPDAAFTPGSADDCSGTWKAFWDGTDMMYVLVEVTDDNNQPGDGMDQPWTFDKVEVYIDANVGNLADAQGASNGAASGHYQFVAQADASLAEGEETADITDNGVVVTGSNYVLEMSINLANVQSSAMAPLTTAGEVFGFDVTIIDNDDGVAGNRGRIGWSNDATASDENWLSMDNAGEAVLSTEGTTSIQSIEAAGIKLYPNPVETQLNISETMQKVEIYSVMGQKVMEVENVNTVNVSALQNGVYVINLTDLNGAVATSRFIK